MQQFTVEQLEDMEVQNAPIDSSMERWSVVLEQYHLSPAYYNKTNRFGTMDGTDGQGKLWKDLSLLETHTYRPEDNTPKTESSPSQPETLSIPSSSPAKPAHHHRAAELAAESQREERDAEDADDDDDDHNDGDNRGGDETKVSDSDVYDSYTSDASAPEKDSEPKMATEESLLSTNQTINYNATDTTARMLQLSKKVDDFIIEASRKQVIAASEAGPIKVQVAMNEYVNSDSEL